MFLDPYKYQGQDQSDLTFGSYNIVLPLNTYIDTEVALVILPKKSYKGLPKDLACVPFVTTHVSTHSWSLGLLHFFMEGLVCAKW